MKTDEEIDIMWPLGHKQKVLIMSAEKFKRIADSTLEIVKIGKYIAPSGQHRNIRTEISNSVNNSILYDDWESFDLPILVQNKNPSIYVTQETVLEACYRLHKKNTCALNFASGTNPGGGFLRGTVAQEETIARSSCLYDTLIKHPDFYLRNKKSADFYYTDDIIYSPDVVVIKDDHGQLLERTYCVSMITSPAPRRAAMEQAGFTEDEIEDKLEACLTKRAEKILMVAAANGHRNLILGAWGCGIFGNDPYMVADVFKDVLSRLPYFDEITFAIYSDKNSPTFDAFESIF